MPSLWYSGEVDGSGTATELPGFMVSARSFVAASKAPPAALNIAAFTPPPPGLNLLANRNNDYP